MAIPWITVITPMPADMLKCGTPIPRLLRIVESHYIPDGARIITIGWNVFQGAVENRAYPVRRKG